MALRPDTETSTLCHDVSKKTTHVYTYRERVYGTDMRLQTMHSRAARKALMEQMHGE